MAKPGNGLDRYFDAKGWSELVYCLTEIFPNPPLSNLFTFELSPQHLNYVFCFLKLFCPYIFPNPEMFYTISFVQV